MTVGETRSARTVADPPPGPTSVVAGHYELVAVHGRGGSASVYRAVDRRDGRIVAVKLFAHGVQGPDRHRQDRELTTLARLEHPGLVTLLDGGADDDRAFLVMEFIDGPSLAEALIDGPLPVERVVRLGARVAAALAYVHAYGVTHRDVKPANVLLDATGEPFLADFGIALLVDATRVTATDALIGTAAYMAPEQLRDAQVDPAADVYALGLVLLEAVTGERAFTGTAVEAVLARLVGPPAIPDTVPAPLAPLVARMTADDPDLRPTAAEVARCLSGEGPVVVRSSAPVTSTGAPGRGRRGRRPRWSPRRVVAAAVALVAVAVGVLFGGWTALDGPASDPGAGRSVMSPALAVPPAPPLPAPGTVAATPAVGAAVGPDAVVPAVGPTTRGAAAPPGTPAPRRHATAAPGRAASSAGGGAPAVANRGGGDDGGHEGHGGGSGGGSGKGGGSGGDG
jgi:tRNA A-37 threonylcarbamoyl transferase component Bud32